MYRKRFRLLAAAAVCTTLALVITQRPAAAEEPQTVDAHVRAAVLLRAVFYGPRRRYSPISSARTRWSSC